MVVVQAEFDPELFARPDLQLGNKSERSLSSGLEATGVDGWKPLELMIFTSCFRSVRRVRKQLLIKSSKLCVYKITLHICT